MCIFCEIINGNIPAKKVYEDDKTLAILDLSQTTYGHTLVMPKVHSENSLQMDDEDLKSVISTCKKVANKLKDSLGAKGINILNNTGEAAGQSVMHTHFHLIPRYENDNFQIIFNENKYDLDEVLAKINKKEAVTK